MKIRGAYGERIEVLAKPPVGGRGAKQSMKEECDINNIMKRFIKTGVITHVNERSPRYGVATSQSYHEAMEVVRSASEDFNALPAKIRKKFDNDPALFMDFVSKKENIDAMRELGLATPKREERKDPMEVLGDRIEKAVKDLKAPVVPPAQ